MAANLYAGGVVSLGTLLAVFLATSDEALLILMAHPGYERDIFFLLIVKVIIAVIAGYLADIFPRFICTKRKSVICATTAAAMTIMALSARP